MFWYPSIGNKGYPYTGWELKYKESAWMTLETIIDIYYSIYRLLRMRYKWSPDIVDSIGINRLFRIYEETKEDFKERTVDEEDYE